MNVASMKGQLEGMTRLLKTAKRELEKKVETLEKENVPEKEKNGNFYSQADKKSRKISFRQSLQAGL